MATRLAVLTEIEKAYDEVVDIIHDSYDHNQFNEAYFEEPFKNWFAKKMDELDVARAKNK